MSRKFITYILISLWALSLSTGCGAKRADIVVDVRRDVRSLNIRGNELYYRGDYEGAARMYDRARLKAMSVDDRAGVAASLNNLGQLYLIARDYAAAEEKFNEARKINEEIGQSRALASNYINLGTVDLRRGDDEGAMEDFDEALALYREDVCRPGEAEAQNAKGLAAFRMGDYERAEGLFLAALKTAEAHKRHRLAAACLQNMGRLRETQGELGGALEYYRRALEQDRMVEYSLGIAGDLTNMARVHEGLGEHAKAKDALERAYAIYVQFGIKDKIDETRLALKDISS